MMCPRLANGWPSSRGEGAGNAGCTLHPRSRAQIVRRNAHEHTGSAEAIRHSPRNGFTAYSALSSATNSFCHRRHADQWSCSPGWISNTSAGLTSATDARTTRLRRTHQRRSSARRLIAHNSRRSSPAITFGAPDAAASTASHPAFVTIAIRPSVGETRRVKPLICPTGPVKYFCGRGLDDPNHFGISAQIEVYAHRIFGRNIWGVNPQNPEWRKRIETFASS
jgi:hypothetical protein